MKKFGKVYFSVFGVVVLVFGIVEFILTEVLDFGSSPVITRIQRIKELENSV